MMDKYFTQGEEEALQALLDRLHRRPELSFQERDTTALIAEETAALGLKPVDLGMETGHVAILAGGRPGPLVAIRADIDAIAGAETATDIAASENPGVMHVCGHDLHTACALGATRLLAEDRDNLPGSVAFIFQPGEEMTEGAVAMFAHGLAEKLPQTPRAIFGLHSWPGLMAGQVGLVEGPMFAGKANFAIHLQGVAGHCGLPHRCTDVIVAGAAVTNAVQTIVSRNADPTKELVCAIVSVKAGDLGFFVTDNMTLTGTIRSLDSATLAMAKARLAEIVKHTAAAYNCQGELEFLTEVPPVINEKKLAALARSAAEGVAGPGAVQGEPTLGSDDFSLFGRLAPAFYFWLGTGFPGRDNPGLHHPSFQVNREALPLGAALLAKAARLATMPGALG